MDVMGPPEMKTILSTIKTRDYVIRSIHFKGGWGEGGK